jgi:eukaryotic-like serine/threonine-protein kinase
MAWRTLACVTLIQMADFAYPVVRIVGGQQLDAALAHSTRALAASAVLVAWAPQQARAQQIRAFSLRLQAGLVAIADSPAQAVELELAAFEVLKLTQNLPQGATVWATDRVPALIRLAITQRAAGAYPEAAATVALALAHTSQRLREDASDEQIQGQTIASVQTTLDLCVHLGNHALAVDVYDTLMRTLPPLQRADHGHYRLWQHQWMDSLQTLVWVRLGALAEAGRGLQRLQDGLALQNLGASTSSLDAELEANVHIATAYLEAAQGHWPATQLAVDAALERLLTMRQRRDPRDAVEAMRAWQLLVRLAQAPFAGAAELGTNTAGAAIKAQLVQQARLAQNELVARGLINPELQAESLWLAACLP